MAAYLSELCHVHSGLVHCVTCSLYFGILVYVIPCWIIQFTVFYVKMSWNVTKYNKSAHKIWIMLFQSLYNTEGVGREAILMFLIITIGLKVVGNNYMIAVLFAVLVQWFHLYSLLVWFSV